MMAVLLRELKSSWKGLLGWGGAIILFQLSGYSKFEGFKSAQSGSINNLTNSFPKALQVLFGMNDLNIATLIGYFGILYLYFALMAAIFSGLKGAGIIAKEERDKTVEFLFVKPISRSRVVLAKIKAGLINVGIIWAIIAVSSILGVAITNGNNFSLSPQILQLMWGILLIALVYFSIGVLCAGVFENPKLPVNITAIVIVLGYICLVMADISNNLAWLRFVSPFKWFSAPSIIQSGHVSYSYALIAIGISAACILAGVVAYRLRDLKTV